MRLGYDLTLEQAQKLIMTPELRQSIQMLQFTSQELNEYLEKEIQTNLLLEKKDDSNQVEDIEDYSQEDCQEQIEWKEFFEKYDDFSYNTQKDKNKEEISYENFLSYSPSLKEHLLFQLNVSVYDKKKRDIGEIIIENIDKNGYLLCTIDSIAQDLKIKSEEVENVLKLIQTFDPIGVGARDIKECLIIQLKDKGIKDFYIYEIIRNYLEDVAYNRLGKISKELDIKLNKVQDICDLIKTLEPKPGRQFIGGSEEIKYITPDVILKYVDGEYIIILNDITGPRLNINKFYKNLITNTNDSNISDYLTRKLNSAIWVIKSIEQRRITIYKVVKSILKFQRNFFERGRKALKPLTLKNVADDIGVHESTVSRATNGKYIQTPMGLFELKYFFSSGVSSENGEVSKISIKAVIKDLIENENTKKPLSDQKITNILKSKDIKISRRTVAKYRDELNIPSSSMRRRY